MTPIFCTRLFFFFNDTATTEIYTLSLHDALPIWGLPRLGSFLVGVTRRYVNDERWIVVGGRDVSIAVRSEEHTSELQSLAYLVCRLLLEKKKSDQQQFLVRGRELSHIMYHRRPIY